MKKILFIAFLLTANTLLMAQKISYGPKIGLTYSNLILDFYKYDYFETSKFGFDIGVIGEIDLFEKASLQLEPGIINKGCKSEREIGKFSKIHLIYFNIPVLFSYNIIKNLNILLGAETEYLLAALSIYKGEKESLYDNFRKIDLGIDAGISYRFNKKIYVGLKYNYGITTTSKMQSTDEYGQPADRLHLFNRVFVLNLGYFLQ